MPRGLNQAQLIGYLGKDPEMKYTATGIAVCNFSMATSESWKSPDGESKERTEWHNIVAWKKLAEICGEYLKKGSQVFIQGKIQNRSYEDKNGQKRYISEIVADQMLMLTSKQAGVAKTEAGPEVGPEPEGAAPSGSGIDDLPFAWVLPFIILGGSIATQVVKAL